MLIWRGRLKTPWVHKSVCSGFFLLITYIISPPRYNWNAFAMVWKNQMGLSPQPLSGTSHLTGRLVRNNVVTTAAVMQPALFCKYAYSYYTAPGTSIIIFRRCRVQQTWAKCWFYCPALLALLCLVISPHSPLVVRLSSNNVCTTIELTRGNHWRSWSCSKWKIIPVLM